MNQKPRAWPNVVSLALLAWSWGCGHDGASPDAGERHLDGLLVSSPFSVSGRTSEVLNGTADAAPSVAYVSMLPGTAHRGATLSVRNEQGGATATAAVVDGGADPVAIAAAVGDELSIILTDSAGHSTPSTEMVKQRRPSRVVRTEPSRGSIDVPLNVRVTVVFSGPIDPATVDPEGITLVQDGRPVAGQTSLSDDGLSLSWTSGAPLSVTTSYVVLLSQRLEDLNGLSVIGFEPVDFMTGAAMESDYGSLQVIVRTSGLPIQVVTNPPQPTDGWQLRVGTIPRPYRIVSGDTLTIARLPQGQYDLGWSVSPNCSPLASVPSQATVVAGSTSHVTAIFTCRPWPARFVANLISAGQSVPLAHELVVRSTGYTPVITATVPANGIATIPLPDAGQYQVSITSSNDQCKMTPSSRELRFDPNGIAAMDLSVTCGAPASMTAAIEFIVRTIGAGVQSDLWDWSPTSVGLTRDNQSYTYSALPNDTLLLRSYNGLDYLTPGLHSVWWEHLAPNCVGDDPPPFQVRDGETAHVTLTATCAVWPGRLQINATIDNPYYAGSLSFSISGGRLPANYPLTHLPASGSGTVPLPIGEYDVSLGGYIPCAVNENPVQHVKVAGAMNVVNFAFTCSEGPAFVRQGVRPQPIR